MYCVYKHYNPINHKVYIGQTKKSNPNDRWQSGQGYQKNPAFFDDIIKYGWDNFIHEILAQGLTKEEADKLESYYIKIYQAYLPEFGYNRNKGNRPRAEKIPMAYVDSRGRLRSFKDTQTEISRYQTKYQKYFG